VGLFLGSSMTVNLAGAGVIITDLFGAVIALIMSDALAEMALVHPVAGSFGIYAERYLSPWAGFSVRATYGCCHIIALGAEVTAIAVYFAFWLPSLPQWTRVVAVSAVLVGTTASSVRRFGECECWFSITARAERSEPVSGAGTERSPRRIFFLLASQRRPTREGEPPDSGPGRPGRLCRWARRRRL